MQYVVFLLDEQQFAIELSAIVRVLAMVNVTPIPNASDEFLGSFNMHGEIIPVINLRKILKIKEKLIDFNDDLLLCKVNEQLLAIWIDGVDRISEIEDNKIEKSKISKVTGIKQSVDENGKIIFIVNLQEILPIQVYNKLETLQKR